LLAYDTYLVLTKTICLIIFCLLCASTSEGQSLSAGTLRGAVTDATSAPLPSAEVNLFSPISGYSRHARTGADGSFVINNVPPNQYDLEVSFAGFRTYHAEIAIQTAVPIDLGAS
jgi:hypothetical protein